MHDTTYSDEVIEEAMLPLWNGRHQRLKIVHNEIQTDSKAHPSGIIHRVLVYMQGVVVHDINSDNKEAAVDSARMFVYQAYLWQTKRLETGT